MNAMAERNVIGQLVQLAVNIENVSISAAVRVKRECISARLVDVSTSRRQERPNLLITVEEKLKRRDARATDSAVAGWIARVYRRAFGVRLWQQIRTVIT